MPSLSPHLKRNLSLAWPLAINGLLMQSMLMIDTIIVSPLGETALAAMGISGMMLAFLLGVQMALANGSQLVISRAVGSKSKTALTQSFWSALIINLSAACLFWIGLTVFQQPLVNAITDNTALAAEVERYLSISKYLLILTALTQVQISLLNGLGQSKVPMKGYLIELPLNVLVSYLFIYGLEFGESTIIQAMGVKGAAIGSVFGISSRFAFLAMKVYRQQVVGPLPANASKTLAPNLRAHFAEVFPIAANVMLLMMGANAYQLMYSQLNMNAYVAITLITPWIRSGTQFVGAWSISSSIIISQAIGSRSLDGMANNVTQSVRVAVTISMIIALLFALLSVLMPSIYPALETETYAALALIAPLYIILPIARGYNTVHGNILRALGRTTDVFKINVVGQWFISIPLCAILIFYTDASFFWAFAIQPFEEIIRMLPLRSRTKKTLASFDLETAESMAH